MRRFAFSDLHGNYELYKQIDNFLTDDDIAICLGDCADRGKQGWETLKAIYENPKITLLMGNHELMLSNAMYEYISNRRGDAENLLARNGGRSSLNDWIYYDQAAPFWAMILENLPLEYNYVNKDGIRLHLSHAGTYPTYSPETKMKTEDYVWNRTFIPHNAWDKEYKDVIMIHGHTPCQILCKELGDSKHQINGAYYYNNGHCIDLDMGTAVSNMTVLLDLDTFDEHIFFFEK